MTTKTKTLIIITAVQAVLMMCVASVLLTLSANTPNVSYGAGDSSHVMDHRPNAKGSAPALIEAHDCWTGEAPEGVEIPGHAVIRTSTTWEYTADVDTAFAIAFDGAHGEVAGFCR